MALPLLPAVRAVCAWLDGIGMGQYRKKFLHHRITGKLLLRVTDAVLKVELGIGPLGHRSLILEGVHRLVHGEDEPESSSSSRYVSFGYWDLAFKSALAKVLDVGSSY